MTKEEEKLLERCGKKNPFKVPEGYFEQFTDHLMEQLPEPAPQEVARIGMWQRMKPWVYMAAMFCGLMLSVRVFVGEPKAEGGHALNDGQEGTELTEEDIDPIVKQVMMDDYTLYQYLTSAEADMNK